MVTSRKRHRYTDADGNIVVVNLDEDLGEGAAKMRVASAGAAPVGHMDPGKKSALKGVYSVSESQSIGKGTPDSWRKKAT